MDPLTLTPALSSTLTSTHLKAHTEDETKKQQVIETDALDLTSEVTDIQEQLDAEEQVLEGLQEYSARTKVQLVELQGGRDDKGRVRLLEEAVEVFGAEQKVVGAEHKKRKEALTGYEKKEKEVKSELDKEVSKLSKEERDMAYKIQTDSRAMGIKQGYAAKLDRDVKESGVEIDKPDEPEMHTPRASVEQAD